MAPGAPGGGAGKKILDALALALEIGDVLPHHPREGALALPEETFDVIMCREVWHCDGLRLAAIKAQAPDLYALHLGIHLKLKAHEAKQLRGASERDGTQ